MSAPHEKAAALTAIPSLRHGFFGRAGGVSTGDYAGLNVSLAQGDQPAQVEANRQIVADTIGLGPLAILKQTHSTRVQTITTSIAPGVIDADAMVTATSGLALGILTADCTPILFADPEAGVIGAAHAGWRGAAEGIALNTIAAMVALGADPARIHAAIGPTIAGRNYEVGDQFRADFLGLNPDGTRFFTTPEGGKPHFDLPGFVEAQLRAAGLAAVENLGRCTYADPARYFSHRYATHQKTKTGRQVAVIGLT
jgi:YfiH family protein